MRWYLTVLRRYVDFNGRARRKEFWVFVLIDQIIFTGLWLVDVVLDLSLGGIGALALTYTIATASPRIAVTTRRLHDTGRSGWWQLVPAAVCGVPATLAVLAPRYHIGILPALALLAGLVWFIVVLASDSARLPNRWGSNPKI